MKFILFLIVTFFFSKLLFAQHFDYKITTYNFRQVDIIDSTINNESSEDIYSFHLHNFYSNHEQFKLFNGSVIKVHIYSDTTILFEEYDSTEVLLSNGELVVDTTKLSIIHSDIPLADEYGEPLIDESGNWIFGADTSYYLVPNGLWYFNIDNYHYELVNFGKGVRNGLSEIKIKSTCLPDSIVISEKIFTNGILTHYSNFELSSIKSLRTTIEGTWYHPNCMDYIFQENPVWVFQRNKPNSTIRDGMFTSKFIRSGRYEGKMNYSCGTGRSKNDYYPNDKWEINENKEIVIGASKYNILYLDMDIMILKEITNHNTQ